MTKNFSEDVAIVIKNIHLEGHLDIPLGAKGLVLFAHGSGSSRFSPRNRFVARFLNEQRVATLLIDLLTSEEERIDEETREFRFSIDLLSQRLLQITEWIAKDGRTQNLSLGYFGSSTGAAAALEAAAQSKHPVHAVVYRGGPPDLAQSFLSQVKAPTLLIVGENDPEVIRLNEEAFELLQCPKRLDIVKGATHLVEEGGCLEKVAKLSSEWFLNYLT